MDKIAVSNLIKSREAIKRKFKDLQSEVVHHENYLEKRYKPIADPLKELLKNVKSEPHNLKSESSSIKPEHISPVASSTPSKPRTSTTSTKRTPPAITPSKPRTSITPTGKRTPPAITPVPPRKLEFLKDEQVLEASGQKDETVYESEEEEFAHIDPEKIREGMEMNTVYQEYLSDFGGYARDYINGIILDFKHKDYDHTYGPKREFKEEGGEYYDTSNWLLGNSILDFSKDGKKIYIKTPDGKKFEYNGSLALYELIFKSLPIRKTIRDDVQAARDYKDILNRTNVHRIGFAPKGRTKGSTGRKYLDYIKPILATKFTADGPINYPFYSGPPKVPGQRPRGKSVSKKGGGILHYTNKKVEYIPYGDPNTLVNRLKVLIGSQLAGNNSVENEIVHIIEELRRRKIIK